MNTEPDLSSSARPEPSSGTDQTATLATPPEDGARAEAPPRLRSLDALRGFTMLGIIGGAEVLVALAALVHNETVDGIVANLAGHSEWEGFTAYDLIFPLFLFISGVTIPLTIETRLAAGERRRAVVGRVVRRGAALFALGLVFNGLLQWPELEHLRVLGVLQRLALGYTVGALLVIFVRRGRTLAWVTGGILVGYWAALAWFPVTLAGSYSQEGNLANAIDRFVFQPGQLYESYGDPEGLLSTVPAVATCLLGVFAGRWLARPHDRTDRTQMRRTVAGLALAGVALLLAGHAWGAWFPVIKKLWTSSYVLVAAGWSLLLLALFYWLIDGRGAVRGSRARWSIVLVVIGVNPLTIYLLQEVVDFNGPAMYVSGGVAARYEVIGPLLLATTALGLKWLLLFVMKRKHIHLRV